MEEQAELRQEVETADASICFLILLVLGLLLSLWATRLQREQLCVLLAGGDDTCCPDVAPLRLWASALSVGTLGFFFTLGLRAWRGAQREGDPAACRQARLNVLAGALVFLAAVLRLWLQLSPAEEGVSREEALAQDLPV